ncbi:MAG: hypothetical protein U1E17_08035 [Geminicoccaceae bacterium]
MEQGLPRRWRPGSPRSPGLKGMAEPLLLQGFCERALALGLPLARATMLVDTPIRSPRAASSAGIAIHRHQPAGRV